MYPERQGLAIWLRSLKHIRQLRKFGHVHYVSKKMKYAIIYCNMANSDEIMRRLESLPFVKNVEPSMRPFVNTEFQKAIPRKEKTFDYNYNMGI